MSPIPPQRANVLLVESDHPTRNILAEHIDQSHDIRVASAATSITEALSILNASSSATSQTHQIAVVASTLTDGTAVDFLSTLNNLKIDLPSIVLSSSGLIKPEQFIAAGAVAHVYKQINGFNLLDTIRQQTLR